MATVSRIKSLIGSIVIFAISIAFFEIVVQPVLAFIHPMFADQAAITFPSRATPTTPAQWALLITVVIVLILSWMVRPVIKAVIKGYLPDGS